jgi:membrane associated rhomboid family serine protease
MARSSRPLDRLSFVDRFSFGGRVPGGLGLVLLLTVVMSLSVAFGERHALELFDLVPLVPGKVLHGQIWRIVTWVWVEPSPISLFFRCLMLYWFGRDLCSIWGSRRFFAIYFGTVLLAGGVTVLLSLLDSDIREQTYLGSMALDAALTIAWGLSFRDRVIRIYFVIPIRGFVLAWGTVALTVAYSIYGGWEHVAPVLVAEAGMLAWFYRVTLRQRWLKYRLSSVQRQIEVERKRRPKTVYEEPMSEEEEEALKARLGRPTRPKPSDLN